MDRGDSRLPNVIILSDSHGKHINRTCSTKFNTIVKAVSGLKWIDYYDNKLSLDSMLVLPDIRSCLSEASAVLFIVGTNSVRIMHASQAIEHAREIIQQVQRNYPHLNEIRKINIALTFPCLKFTKRFSNKDLLLSNIIEYNQRLERLSLDMNFTTIDLSITEYHLAKDRIHVNTRFHDIIINAVTNHFNELFPEPSTSTSNDIEVLSQSDQRSNQSNDRRNEKRQEKLNRKLADHMIKRKILSQWTLADVKQYLRSIHVKYGRILPIFNKTVRIQFYKEDDKNVADNILEIDQFNEDRYQEFIKNKKS